MPDPEEYWPVGHEGHTPLPVPMIGVREYLPPSHNMHDEASEKPLPEEYWPATHAMQLTLLPTPVVYVPGMQRVQAVTAPVLELHVPAIQLTQVPAVPDVRY